MSVVKAEEVVIIDQAGRHPVHYAVTLHDGVAVIYQPCSIIGAYRIPKNSVEVNIGDVFTLPNGKQYKTERVQEPAGRVGIDFTLALRDG